eukprot:1193961-Prorocentrum_minimum.AAC.3
MFVRKQLALFLAAAAVEDAVDESSWPLRAAPGRYDPLAYYPVTIDAGLGRHSEKKKLKWLAQSCNKPFMQCWCRCGPRPASETV